MDSRSLMLGNYVYCNARNLSNAICRVVSIDYEELSLMIFDTGFIFSCSNEDVVGIPISHQILKDIGIVASDDWGFNSNDEFILFFDNVIEFYPMYVHELQNLIKVLETAYEI